MQKEQKKSAYWNIGIAIALGAGLGVVLGIIFDDIAVWLPIGAGVGVAIGAISQTKKTEK